MSGVLPKSRRFSPFPDVYVYDEDKRFAIHQLSSLCKTTLERLSAVRGVRAVAVLDLSTGVVLDHSSHLYDADVMALWAAHMPALWHRSQAAAAGIDDEDATVMLMISTRKCEVVLSADHESGVAVLVLQDRHCSIGTLPMMD